MTDPRDPFEQHLTDELHALVGDERAPADLADRAHDRIGSRSTHRGRLVAAAVGSAAVLAAVALVALPDDDQARVRAFDDGSTTTSESTTTTGPTTTESTATTEALVPVESTTTMDGVTTTSIDPPPEPMCIEDVGEIYLNDGWEGHWQTDPGPNAPAAIRVCVDDVTPRVGQVVHVTLVGDDPDAVLLDEECGWDVRFDGLASLCRDYILEPADEPRPTPAKEVGHIERTASHAFGSVGPATVLAAVRSADFDGTRHPYASYVAVSISLEVHD
ncbi:MAG: hypothetical protein ABL966_04680 [Acidimicrobiales bacterium]